MNHHALVNNSSNPYLFMIVCQKVVMIVLSYYTIIIDYIIYYIIYYII